MEKMVKSNQSAVWTAGLDEKFREIMDCLRWPLMTVAGTLTHQVAPLNRLLLVKYYLLFCQSENKNMGFSQGQGNNY